MFCGLMEWTDMYNSFTSIIVLFYSFAFPTFLQLSGIMFLIMLIKMAELIQHIFFLGEGKINFKIRFFVMSLDSQKLVILPVIIKVPSSHCNSEIFLVLQTKTIWEGQYYLLQQKIQSMFCISSQQNVVKVYSCRLQVAFYFEMFSLL